MTNFIVLFIIITVILLCAISCIVEYMKEKKRQREYNEQLNSVVPGTLLVRRYHMTNNPFVTSPTNETSIKILEVKKDTSGEIWIKYAYEDLWNNNRYIENFPCYDKLENKLYSYPNIVFNTILPEKE